MFYAHFVLAKKGPLARIWLAAHWDKKLTKAHVYETNIESSVEGIMQPKVKMALRTSGHLLLGVVRIYSRKAKYLLADCNEAFVKIKMAFRPGMVDLPEDKREAAMNAITLPDVFHDFDTAMPEFDDVDIDDQFTLNQTRAEEITMREDYGNITLTTGDDGFGDSMDHMELEEPRSPEMLRDASHMGEHFGSIGGEDINLDEESAKMRELSAAGPSTSRAAMEDNADGEILDAPIHDDGFGGVGVQDILSGGLFEGGSLFDDPVPGGVGSIRIPPSERTGFEDDDFPGIPSPMHSDGSRPGTPIDNESLSGGDVLPAPELDQTPVPPSPAHSMHSVHSLKPPGSVHGDKEPIHETTTLLHNEEESFALAPVEASQLKGDRRKRKRKLIVDEIKAITGEGMKAQLSDSADIVTTLDIAPPTKRLMHWKETGGVEELFNLPGRRIRSRVIILDYQNNLKMKSVADELFDTLPGNSHHDDFHLDNVGGREQYQEDDEDYVVTKRKAPKRKINEPPAKSAYLKRQEELARQQEEFSAQQKRVREEQEAMQEEKMREPEPNVNISLDPNVNISLEPNVNISLEPPVQEPPVQEGWGENFSTNNPAGYQTPGYEPQNHSFGQVGFATPGGGQSAYAPPSMGYPTPVHEPSYTTPTHQTAGYPPNDSALTAGYPGPPTTNLTPVDQATFTQQWVNQVQTNPPSMMSPPHQPSMMSPSHQPNLVSPEHQTTVISPHQEQPETIESPPNKGALSTPTKSIPAPCNIEESPEKVIQEQIQVDKNTPRKKTINYEEASEEDEEEESEEEDEYGEEYPKEKQGNENEEDMQEDETIEEFEDRVLNKRAAQLHSLMTRKFADTFSQMTRKNNRKQASQKFHSLLVLQKMMAVEVSQESNPPYADIKIVKGSAFKTASKHI